MIRGTTPTLEFQLPFETDVIQKAYVTFATGATVVLEKSIDDCICKGDKLIIKMSQRDTLALTGGAVVDIQIRVLTFENEALASNIIRTSVSQILKDGEI